MNKILLLLGTAACVMTSAGTANAQVAGETTLGVAVTDMAQLANGWSAKKTLLSKDVYSDSGEKVGKVEDIIIAPNKTVSYVIVSAGGFIGVGSHDVAIPVSQIVDQAGKLTVSGASKATVKAMPAFSYARRAAL